MARYYCGAPCDWGSKFKGYDPPVPTVAPPVIVPAGPSHWRSFASLFQYDKVSIDLQTRACTSDFPPKDPVFQKQQNTYSVTL